MTKETATMVTTTKKEKNVKVYLTKSEEGELLGPVEVPEGEDALALAQDKYGDRVKTVHEKKTKKPKNKAPTEEEEGEYTMPLATPIKEEEKTQEEVDELKIQNRVNKLILKVGKGVKKDPDKENILKKYRVEESWLTKDRLKKATEYLKEKASDELGDPKDGEKGDIKNALDNYGKTGKKAKAKGSGVGLDRFGCRVGKDAAKINTAMEEIAKTAQEISEEVNLPLSRVTGHLRWHTKAGSFEKTDKGYKISSEFLEKEAKAKKEPQKTE